MLYLPKNHPLQKRLNLRNKCDLKSNHVLDIGFVNLTPKVIDDEFFFMQKLQQTDFPIRPFFFTPEAKIERSREGLFYLKKYYLPIGKKVPETNLDGLIITGAVHEKLDFEKTPQWQELIWLFAYARKKIICTFCSCWTVNAMLYHFYRIPKIIFPKKLAGLFQFKKINSKSIFIEKISESPKIFQSRHCGVKEDDLNILTQKKEIIPLLYSVEHPRALENHPIGTTMFSAMNGKFLLQFGHPEYPVDRLAQEVARDDKILPREKRYPVEHYFIDEVNRRGLPVNTWQRDSNQIFSNFLKYIWTKKFHQ